MDDSTIEVQSTHLSQLIEPIMKEFKSLKDTMVSQKSEISDELNRLKKVITSQKSEIINEINIKVDTNSKSILKVLNENQELKRELKELKEHVSKIETAQLSNNIIVTGISEQPFETYEKTKQRTYDIFAEAIKNPNTTQKTSAMNTAKNIDITYCSRVGKSRPGQNRPISVSLGHKEDKEKLMSIKTKLPQGIYMNNEYPIHIKRAKDTLCPILHLVKSLPSYQDKSKIEGDHLVIDGIKYGLQDLHNLPAELAGYKAAQEEDEEFIALQGELSPYSNFHHAKFVIDNHTYHSSE